MVVVGNNTPMSVGWLLQSFDKEEMNSKSRLGLFMVITTLTVYVVVIHRRDSIGITSGYFSRMFSSER